MVGVWPQQEAAFHRSVAIAGTTSLQGAKLQGRAIRQAFFSADQAVEVGGNSLRRLLAPTVALLPMLLNTLGERIPLLSSLLQHALAS
jgi:hypothetical protein